MLNVAIIDYDCGNMFSILRCLERFNVEVSVTSDPAAIIKADRLILPGVGGFGEGMRALKERNLTEPIKEFAKSGKGLLGICLGMQLLLDSSEEFGYNEGLGLIPGNVVLLKPLNDEKIPHIGWNSLLMPGHQSSSSWKGSLLKDFTPGKDVYFVHSYRAATKNDKDCLAVTNYGGVGFPSVIKRDNITGCQFHPEKSGKNGIQMVYNFLFM